MKRPSIFAIIFVAVCAVSTGVKAEKHPKKSHKTAASVPYAARTDVMAFADALAQREGMDRQWLRQSLAQAHKVARIRTLMLPATHVQAKDWQAYRARFIDPVRIRGGLQFWQTHAPWLARAEQQYGVPAAIIVAILGVETIYGANMGGFRVLDALATLTFDFPPQHPRAAQRQAYFQGELEQFLRQSWTSASDPKAVRGSYAGAMGMPQFMPTSALRWAVDFDGDGRINLAGSAPDAIGSVAHYFQAHGWKTAMPTHYPVEMHTDEAQLQTLLAPDIKPEFLAQDMAELGVQVLGAGVLHNGPLALIELKNGTRAPQYVAGTENFYAITRYNWSSYYAMAVIELAQALAQGRGL